MRRVLARHWYWLLPVVLVAAGTGLLLAWGAAPERIGGYTPW